MTKKKKQETDPASDAFDFFNDDMDFSHFFFESKKIETVSVMRVLETAKEQWRKRYVSLPPTIQEQVKRWIYALVGKDGEKLESRDVDVLRELVISDSAGLFRDIESATSSKVQYIKEVTAEGIESLICTSAKTTGESGNVNVPKSLVIAGMLIREAERRVKSGKQPAAWHVLCSAHLYLGHALHLNKSEQRRLDLDRSKLARDAFVARLLLREMTKQAKSRKPPKNLLQLQTKIQMGLRNRPTVEAKLKQIFTTHSFDDALNELNVSLNTWTRPDSPFPVVRETFQYLIGKISAKRWAISCPLDARGNPIVETPTISANIDIIRVGKSKRRHSTHVRVSSGAGEALMQALDDI